MVGYTVQCTEPSDWNSHSVVSLPIRRTHHAENTVAGDPSYLLAARDRLDLAPSAILDTCSQTKCQSALSAEVPSHRLDVEVAVVAGRSPYRRASRAQGGEAWDALLGGRRETSPCLRDDDGTSLARLQTDLTLDAFLLIDEVRFLLYAQYGLLRALSGA